MKQGKKFSASAILSTTGPSKRNGLPQVEKLSTLSNAGIPEVPAAGEVTRKSSQASVPSTCNASANAIGSNLTKENITQAPTAGHKRGADAVENSTKKYRNIHLEHIKMLMAPFGSPVQPNKCAQLCVEVCETQLSFPIYT